MIQRYRELVVTRPYESEVAPIEVHSKEHATIVQILYSGISVGTEMSIYRGSNIRFLRQDDMRGERIAPLEYPVHSMGYMEVGTVLSSPLTRDLEGRTVALKCGHRTMAILERPDITPLPPGIPAVCGVWVQNFLPICANALLHAAFDERASSLETLADGVTGRRIAVIGSGVIAVLLACWIRHLGGDVVVADTSRRRLAAADRLGLKTIASASPWDEIRSSWQSGPTDMGADLVMQCRGNVRALQAALRCVRPHHTVVDLGFYQDQVPALSLSGDYHHQGLTLRAAQVGNQPRGLEAIWTKHRLIQEGLSFLMKTHALLAEVLLADQVPFESAPAFLGHLAATPDQPPYTPVLSV
jgi:NADPH:quinone reductase-like Zn-dependent oxidoreductase